MKPRILFINSVCGFGSTGRIVADLASNDNFETLVCFGRKKDYANINSYKFANFFDNAFGALGTILFDNNLNICSTATKRLIKKIKEFNPDIIHLHNLHGYYVNIEMLFKFLKEYNKPVVWTLHDCWSFTGYCPFFDYVDCNKYENECVNCQYGFSYPFSLFKQNTKRNFYKKKVMFSNLNNFVFVACSEWLKDKAMNSIIGKNDIRVVNNGINLNDFKPSKNKKDKFTISAVANYWTKEKGIDELNKIIPLLDKDIDVIAVGGNSSAINGCKAIERTNNKNELIDLYSSAHLLINPTLQDNLPTVIIESLACGTPVVTYKTGGAPEIIDKKTGVAIERKNYIDLANTINKLKKDYSFIMNDCVKRSILFSVENMNKKYEELYESMLVK